MLMRYIHPLLVDYVAISEPIVVHLQHNLVFSCEVL
jgi:hypothetical protein